MSIEQLLNKNIDRREFLKGSGKAVAGLAGMLSGCAPTLKETRQEVAQIHWDCNPILPILKEGCYTGTNVQWMGGATTQFREKYGIMPAFNALGIGIYATHNELFDFLRYDCQKLVDNSIIPVLRYVTEPRGYKPVIQGKFDDSFKSFACQVADFGKPIVILPWQCANEPSGRIWPWSGPPAGQYKEAWIRMHNIFQKEGANKNVIWSTKLISGRWAYETMNDPIPYIPPKEYVDIIGWNCSSDLERAAKSGANLSFNAQFRYEYNRAASRYPMKPQMFWELGASIGPDQARWFDDALGKIRTKYPRVKGVMFDECSNAGYHPWHTPETVKVIRKHFASGYFWGSALKK